MLVKRKRDHTWPLRQAALLYGVALHDATYVMKGSESKLDAFSRRELVKAWDQLRKAALRYRDRPRKHGRPRGKKPRKSRAKA